MINLTVLRDQLQIRINALTNDSPFDDVIDVAIATKKAVRTGLLINRNNIDVQLQRVANAVGAGSAIDDLITIAASAEGDGDSIPIGTIQQFPFSGETFTDNNNFQWLLRGLLFTKTGYDKALAIPGLRSYGRQVYTAKASTAGRVTKAADDGLGNIVIACGSLTHVMVSNDAGENFRPVAHNHPNRVVTVEYVGGHFIVASNSSDAIRTSFSSDGGSTFSNAAVARALGAGTVDTVRSSVGGGVALFVVSNDKYAVIKTNGVSNSAIELPAAVNGASYIPLVQYFNGAFYVAGKNVPTYYKTTNNGENFSTHVKPIGTLTEEHLCVSLGKFFWMGQSGSGRYYKYTSDFVTWYDLWDVLPTALKAIILEGPNNPTIITLFPVTDGLLICTAIGNYFTSDLINYSLVHFSRSAAELAGNGAEYYCHKNIVLGGTRVMDGSTATLNSSILKVNYSAPDYVGLHRNGVATIISDTVDYVRIK